MHAVTSDYKSTEQNRVPLSNLSLVMTSYCLWATGSQLPWAARVRHRDYPEKLRSRSTYSIATMLYVHHSYPSDGLTCHRLLIVPSGIFHGEVISENFSPRNTCMSLLVAQRLNCCHVIYAYSTLFNCTMPTMW